MKSENSPWAKALSSWEGSRGEGAGKQPAGELPPQAAVLLWTPEGSSSEEGASLPRQGKAGGEQESHVWVLQAVFPGLLLHRHVTGASHGRVL